MIPADSLFASSQLIIFRGDRDRAKVGAVCLRLRRPKGHSHPLGGVFVPGFRMPDWREDQNHALCVSDLRRGLTGVGLYRATTDTARIGAHIQANDGRTGDLVGGSSAITRSRADLYAAKAGRLSETEGLFPARNARSAARRSSPIARMAPCQRNSSPRA
jgi:hypothetical protein